jgi:hypothetical protein
MANSVQPFARYCARETRTTISVLHLGRFTDRGLIEFPKDGPGSVKEELKDILRRSLWSSRDGSEATSGRHRLGSEVAAGWRP